MIIKEIQEALRKEDNSFGESLSCQLILMADASMLHVPLLQSQFKIEKTSLALCRWDPLSKYTKVHLHPYMWCKDQLMHIKSSQIANNYRPN